MLQNQQRNHLLWRHGLQTCFAGVGLALGVAANAGAVEICFAPGTSVLEVQARMVAAEQAAALAVETGASPGAGNVGSRWLVTASEPEVGPRGSPIVLTWGIASEGTQIPSGIGEPAGPSDLGVRLDALYGSRSVWLPLIEEAIESWTIDTGITLIFEPEDDGLIIAASSSGVLGVRADIRLAGHAIDGNDQTVAYGHPPQHGDVVLDTSDDYFDNTGSDSLRLRNTVAHEIGHALGLGHVCPADNTKLMEPFIPTGFEGPALDDTLAVQYNYGDWAEQDDLPAEAPLVGLGEAESLTRPALSLDGSDNLDWLAFFLLSPSQIDASIAPIGAPYLLGETGPGTCGGVPTSVFDPRSVSDLALEVLGADAITVLASADAVGPGQPESLSGVPLAAGLHYLRVSGEPVDDVQGYDLEIRNVPEPDANLMGLSVLSSLAWLVQAARAPKGAAVDRGADPDELLATT